MPLLKGVTEKLSQCIEKMHQQQLSKINKKFSDMSDKENVDTALAMQLNSISVSVTYCEQFAISTKKVLLLSGDNFSGKTISTQSLLLKLLQASFDLQILPIYIDLDNVDDIKKPFIEKFLLETYHLTNEHISELKKQDSVLFIFDHYGNKGICVNLYTTQQLASWNGKSIVISDLSHLAKFSDYRPCFIPYHNQRRQPELYEELVSPSPVMQNKTTPFRQKDDGNTKNAASRATPPSWQSTAKQSFENTRPQASPKINRIIEDDELINHPLNERLLTHDENIMRNLADKAKSDLNFRKFLLDLIYKSRNEPRLSKAAANAITALNYAKINLSGLDFSRCHIPGADLRGAILDHTNFSGADLSNVDFQGAWLRKTNVTDAKMDGVHFGEKPYFKLLQPIIKSHLLPDESLLSIVQGSDKEDKDRIYIYHNNSKTPFCMEDYSDSYYLFAKVTTSLDGSLAVVIDNKDYHCVHLIEIYTGVRLKTFIIPQKDNVATTIAFSQDNTLLAVGCSEGAIYIFDIITGDLFVSTNLVEGNIESLSFNATNNLLASLHEYDKTANSHLWEISRSSQRIVHKHYFRFKDVESPAKERKLELSSGHSLAMNLFSNDNKYLISGYTDVKIWSLTTLKLIYTIKSTDNSTSNCISLSQDNRYLAVGFGPNITIYNFEDGRTLYSLEGHEDKITGLMFNVSGKSLMSSDSKGTIRFWDAATFAKKQFAKEEKSEVNIAVISPDNKFLAIANGGKLNLWIISKWLKLCTIDIDKWAITAITFHPNSQSIALSGKFSHAIHVFDIKAYLTTRNIVLQHYWGEYHVADVTPTELISIDEGISTPGKYATKMHGFVNIPSPMTGSEFIQDIIGHYIHDHGRVNFVPNYRIDGIAFDDNYMVATNSDGSLHIWDRKRLEDKWPSICTCPYKTNIGHEPYLEGDSTFQVLTSSKYVAANKIGYIPEKRQFIMVKSHSEEIRYNKNEVFLFEPSNLKPGSISGHSLKIDLNNKTDTSSNILPIVDFVLSNDRRFIFIAHKKKIFAIDLQTNLDCKLDIKYDRQITCISISPCDRYISIGFSDNTLEVWRHVFGKHINIEFSIYEIKGSILSISWGQDEDGLFFVTSSKDNVARCWRLISINDKLDAMLCWSSIQNSLDAHGADISNASGLTVDDQILLGQHNAQGKPLISNKSLESDRDDSILFDDLDLSFKRLGIFPLSKKLKLPKIPYQVAFLWWDTKNDADAEIVRIRRNSSKAAKRFQQGNQAIIEKELDKAITFFQRTIAIEDKICIFHQQLAYCYWLKALRDKNDDYFQQASESLKAALRLEANAKLYIFCALYLYQNKSFHTEALYYLDKAANFLSKHNDYQFHFKEFDKMLLPLELQSQIGEKRATTIAASSLGYYLIINIYFFQSERVNANQYLTRFISDVAKNPTAMSYSLLGYCHKLLGNFAEAAYCFVQARDLDGNHPLTEENARECFALAGINIPEENESATVSSSTPDDEDEQVRQAIALSLGKASP